MSDLIRKVSLVGNVVLAIGLTAAVAWGWRVRALGATQGESAGEYRLMTKTYEAFILDKLAALSIVGLELPKVELTSVTGGSFNTDLSDRKAGLVLLFKPEVCQPCLITQLRALEHVWANRVDSTEILVFAASQSPPGDLRRYTRAFGLSYPVVSDLRGEIVTEELSSSTPVVLLVNHENTIVDAHIPSPGKPEFSLLFYNEMRIGRRTGATLDWERYNFGLAGTPKIDVILNRFEAPSAIAEALLQ